jgi:hypothetical protein
MAQTTHDLFPLIGPREMEEMELYHPKTWLGKYVFCQDAKVIAIQYSLTAIAIGQFPIENKLFVPLPMRTDETTIVTDHHFGCTLGIKGQGYFLVGFVGDR